MGERTFQEPQFHDEYARVVYEMRRFRHIAAQWGPEAPYPHDNPNMPCPWCDDAPAGVCDDE